MTPYACNPTEEFIYTPQCSVNECFLHVIGCLWKVLTRNPYTYELYFNLEVNLEVCAPFVCTQTTHILRGKEPNSQKERYPDIFTGIFACTAEIVYKVTAYKVKSLIK